MFRNDGIEAVGAIREVSIKLMLLCVPFNKQGQTRHSSPPDSHELPGRRDLMAVEERDQGIDLALAGVSLRPL
jgi:hypothetical protein